MERDRRLPVAVCALALVLGAAAAGAGEGKRAFEIADYYRTVFVGAPVVSPAGDRVAFTLQHFALEEGESWSELWTMAPDGGALRQMTHGRHHDASPTFTPDGRHLVFVSDREGASGQLFMIPVDGGGVRQLTDFPVALAAPVVSPDGRWIAVAAEVYPECGADAECNRTIQSAVDEGPLAAHLADELLYRHWTSWRDGRFTHVLLVDAASGEVVRDVTPGRWDTPVFSLGGDTGYVFTPDSKALVVTSNRGPKPAESTDADLWLVPLDSDSGAGVRNLTDENDGWDGDPAPSPDGGRIAFRSQAKPGFEADLFRLAVLDRSRGTVRYLTGRDDFGHWVTDVRWDPSGRTLYVQADRRGRTPILRVAAAGGELETVVEDATVDGWDLTPDGKWILYARRAVGAPPEIFRVRTDGTGRERLTHFNADLEAEVDIRPAEEMWVDAGDGRRIQVFVVKPHGFDPAKRYPLILNVHGGPQQAWTDAYRGDWQVYPGRGYVVAFPNPTGSPGFGQDFVDAISCDWGGEVYRDVMKVTDALAALPYVDAERMGAMGWSYGGYMMMWLEGHTDRFKALAAMMGVYDLRSMYSATEELWFPEHDLCGTPWENPEHYREMSPSSYVERFATPCLVVTGEKDFRVPYTQSLMFFTDLQKRDVPSRLVVFPGAGHWPSWYEMAFYYTVHLEWFERWLGGGGPPWEVERFLRNQVFDDEE